MVSKINYKVIIDFLSRKWSLPQKSITIIKGATSNYKTINIKNENWDPYNIEITQ